MPIYAYRCSACGFEKDYLQKVSDPVLTECPECGRSTFTKQITAAGFQLKGSGWYATDFKGKGSSKPAAEEAGEASDSSKKDKKEDSKAGAACPGGACTCH